MKFIISGNKDGSSHEGVLYCAQRLEEMLMGHTSHLYKVPVYNTFLLANEYLETASLVDNGLLDKTHLNNIMDEFINELKGDIVINSFLPGKEVSYFTSALKSASLSDQKKLVNYLLFKIKNYPTWCLEVLKKTCAMPRRKKDIESAMRSAIPMFIGMGYSPDYIYQFCLDSLKDKKLSDTSLLDDFFSKFNGYDNKYTVYCAIDKRFKFFAPMLTKTINISFKSRKSGKEFKYNKRKYVRVNTIIFATDNYRAAEQVYRNIGLFVKYHNFLSDRNESWHDENAMVIDSQSNTFIIPFKPRTYLYTKDFNDITVEDNSENIITKLLENKGTTDYNRINKIIKIHNMALNSEDANTAFMNLWSIMEIIGVSAQDESKIQKVLKSVVPILLHNYAKNVFKQIQCDLKDNLEAEYYQSILQSVSAGNNEIEKVAMLITLPEYRAVRESTYSRLTSFSLLKNRISVLHDDVFRTQKAFIKKLRNYQHRLEWHIQRIYRVRNAIIHSGETADRIRDLVEHLHAYVDEVIFEIIRRMTQEDSLITIENVLVYNKVYIDNLFNDFSSDEDFTEADIKRLLE